MNVVLDTVPVKVTPTMNDGLIVPFSKREVKEALFQLFPTKAPELEGFSTHFFSATGTCAVLM